MAGAVDGLGEVWSEEAPCGGNGYDSSSVLSRGTGVGWSKDREKEGDSERWDEVGDEVEEYW